MSRSNTDKTLKQNLSFNCTSPEFFNKNKDFFDIIFIDGLHLEYQVDKDIEGSLKFLSKDGFIILHDCNPPTEFQQRENYEVDGKFPPWNGTVWKSFAKLRMTNSNLMMCCVPSTNTCKSHVPSELTYQEMLVDVA